MQTSSSSNAAWDNLPTEQKEVFNNIAYKDGDPSMDGQDWFEHLVPEPIQDQPEMVEVFMDGGTVTKEVWVHDQGVGNGHYEQVTYEVADKDVSRITSGANGGEYTPDNTVMEDASANRARGAEDMSPQELENIEQANTIESEFLDGADVMVEGFSEGGAELATEAATAAELAGDLLTDIAAPAIGAYLAGTAVAKQMTTTEDKLGYGALAAGGAALICATPVGAAGLGLFCAAKVGITIGKFIVRKSGWTDHPYYS